VLVALAATLAPVRLHRGLREMPPPVWSVPVRAKVVAITYDDGPHPVYTPALLRILREQRVRATFFMIGTRMQRWPWIVEEAAADGHVIANHTYSHQRYLARDTHAQIVREIRSGQKVITRLTGQRYRLFRPPKGFLGNHVLRIADSMGYRAVLWSLSAYHYEGGRTPELMTQRVLSLVRPGAIILMHDGRYPMRWRDVQATPMIISALRKKGYRFVTVPELLEMGKAKG
jgi:peptidoglycan/xylan/chitin deacetylase (PgdA/CDA1 family)